MRSFHTAKVASLFALPALLSLTVLLPEPAQFTESILEVHAGSLTDCLQGEASNGQDVWLSPSFRGVELQGTVRTVSTMVQDFEANPFEPTQSGCGTPETPIRLDIGTPTIQEVDISLPSLGPQWIIARSFNALQEECGSGHRVSDGWQGRNWFQDSRPELVLYKENGAAEANDEEDILYLVYRADAFLEFKRTGDSENTFKGTNGASGVIQHSEGSQGDPDTLTFTNQKGVKYTFFGFNTGHKLSDGSLWKIEDVAGNTAYVGDSSDAGDAITNGFDGSGYITSAYDASGREFTYSYGLVDGTKRLQEVKVEVEENLIKKLVTKVEYEYYGNETYGDSGALKLVTITVPQSDDNVEVKKKQYYRYWEGTYDATNNPGHPHSLKYVIGYEGTRNQDWKDGNFDKDFLTETDANLELYAEAYFEYDSDRLVREAWSSGSCGCSSAINGAHKYAYEENSSYTNGVGYDTEWANRTIVERPDGSYLTQYFDEAGQPLGKVITDGNPATGNPDTWVTDVVRNSDGLITDIYNPSAVSSYTHSTGLVSHKASAGLVTSYVRESTGTTAGYVLDQQHMEGTGGTAFFDRSWEYDEAQLVVGPTRVVRPYVDKFTVYTEEVDPPTSGNYSTEIDLEFYVGAGEELTVKAETVWLPVVSTSKNGPGDVSSVPGKENPNRGRYFRKDGLVEFQRALDGVITYREYTDGLVSKQIVDADTSLSGVNQDFNGVTIPTDFTSSGGGYFHKKVELEYDRQARLETRTRYRGTTADYSANYYTHLADHSEVVLSFPKKDGTKHYGPVDYMVYTQDGSMLADARIALPNNESTDALSTYIDETDEDPVGAVTKGALCRLSTTGYSADGGRVEEVRLYHTIPTSGGGAAGTNYDLTQYGYDDMGRRVRTVDPTGTIDRMEYDKLGRVEALHTGTNDSSFPGGTSGTDNMVKVEEREYDSGGDDADSHLTKVTQFIEDSTTEQRVFEFSYDYRGRRLLLKSPESPHVLSAYDNLGRVTASAQYSSTSSITVGTTDPAATGTQSGRMALNETEYDEQGRQWRSVRHEVDQGDGSLGESLEALSWFDEESRQIKTDGSELSKSRYDRLGRMSHHFVIGYSNDAANDYDDVLDLLGDYVLEESQTIYDVEDDTVVATVRIDRHHDDDASVTGTVGVLDIDSDDDPDKYPPSDVKGRIQIIAHWYDEFDRRTETVRYGTHAYGTPEELTFDRGSLGDTVPDRSDTALRTSIAYNDDGEVESITDPKGLVSYWEFDDQGRKVKEVRNYDDSVSMGAPSGENDNQTVKWAYEDGLLKTITADVPSTGTDQVTTYVYGVTQTDSPGPSRIYSNRLLREIQYPDKASAEDVIRLAYNAQQEQFWSKDQAGNVLERDIDSLGRTTEHRVTTLASGFDGAVRRISVAYDGLGRQEFVTQHDNATVGQGSVIDQVGYTYTDWGPLEKFRQDRNSTLVAENVVGSDDYTLTYEYEKATEGRNTIRRLRMQVPNGKDSGDPTVRLVTKNNFNYDRNGGEDLDHAASRVSRVRKGGLAIADYDYNGVGHVVGTTYTQPDMFYHLHDSTGYPGLDRFNRVITTKWTKDLATLRNFIHEEVTYDRNSNIVRVEDKVLVDVNNTQNQSKFDSVYEMDDLDRLVEHDVGEWSGTALTNRQRKWEWTLDHLGNWSIAQFDEDGDGAYTGSTDINDDRTHNDVNELTARDTDDDGTNDDVLVYDPVGNLTDDDADFQYTYDAFGRLTKIENQDPTPKVIAEYKYNGLGFQISELLDTNDDGQANSSDVWFHTMYDESWRALQVYRGDDEKPKLEYVNHNAGLGGYGGSSYIDGVAYRRRDGNTANWASEAADGVFDEKLFYCQNWRQDVVAVADFRGYVHEWVKYSAYGVPYGIPAGDDDVSGKTDGADYTRIQNRITGGWAYSVLADINLDGSIVPQDKTDAQNLYDGRELGYGVLSHAEVSNRRGWTGLRYLSELAGLWLARNRMSEATLGRWARRDPLGYVDGMSQYELTGSNPVRLLDPLGLSHSMAPATGAGGPARKGSKGTGTRKYYSGPGIGILERGATGWPKKSPGLKGILDELLAAQNDDCCVRTLVLVFHGAGPGNLRFGDDPNEDMVSADRQHTTPGRRPAPIVSRRERLLRSIGNAMCDDCWIVFKSCGTAHGAKGLASMQMLAKLTGCKVMAWACDLEPENEWDKTPRAVSPDGAEISKGDPGPGTVGNVGQ